MPGRLGADAAHADDEGGGLEQVDCPYSCVFRGPGTAELLGQVVLEAAGEGQHEGHDVRSDVVVIDAPEVRDRHRVLDQFSRVVARRRCGCRGLQPAQLLALFEYAVREGAVGGVGILDLLLYRSYIVNNHNLYLGQRLAEPAGPASGGIALRGSRSSLKPIVSPLSSRAFLRLEHHFLMRATIPSSRVASSRLRRSALRLSSSVPCTGVSN